MTAPFTRPAFATRTAGPCQPVVVDRGPTGLGVVTPVPLAFRATVLSFAGPRCLLAAVDDFTHMLEVDVGVFLGRSGGPDDYVNHSCDPNAYLFSDRHDMYLRAARRIRAGEEITFDYATAIVTDPTRFECACGSAACRGVVGPFLELPDTVRSRYLRRGMVPAFVRHHAVATRRPAHPVARG